MIERLANRRLFVGLGLLVLVAGTGAVLGPRTWARLSGPPVDDRLDDLNRLAAATPLPAPPHPQAVTAMVGVAGSTPKSSDPSAVPTPTPVTASIGRGTAPVQRGPISEVLRLTGRVVAQDESPVTASLAGRLATLQVKPGQAVKAGDLLASLDTQQLDRDLDAANTRVDDATARLKAAQDQLEAQQREDEQRQAADQAQREGGVAEADASLAHTLADLQALKSALSPDQVAVVDPAIADVNQSRAALASAAAAIQSVPGPSDGPPVDVDGPQHALQQAQAHLSELQGKLAASQVQAPFDGTVTAVQMRPGDPVQKGQTLVLLAKPGESHVQINLTEEDAARLAVGDKATVTLEDADGSQSDASVISMTTGRDGKPASAQIEANWSSSPPAYGKTVDVAITVEAKTETLIVPSKAVHTLGSRHLVDALDGSARHTVAVQIGIVAGQETEILQGLTEGQVVQVDP